MYLKEEEITIEKIASIFAGAFLEVSEPKNNSFTIKGPDSKISTILFFSPNEKKFMFRFFSTLKKISETEAAYICNKINESIVMVRFSVVQLPDVDLVITSEYEMTYEKGLIPYHAMANYRLFEKIVPHVLLNNFESYL